MAPVPAADVLRIDARRARVDVRAGALRRDALLDRLRSVPFLDRDAWVDELLGIEELPPDVPGLPRESVPYLPSGVEEIIALVVETPIGPHDRLVDLGAGLGRAVVLAHLLSGARAVGVEIQEPLVRSARARCADLALAEVSFLHANAADVELDGSVFFLYAPFNGATLARVMQRLEALARTRSIVIATVGLELHDVRWLVPRPTSCASLMLYDAHGRDVAALSATCASS